MNLKRIKFCIFSFNLFFLQDIYSVIVKIEQITNKNGQEIILISDNHDLKSNQIENQLKCLANCFSTFNKNEKFFIFLEKPPQIRDLSTNKLTILSNLFEVLNQFQLNNIYLENIEKRLISIASYFILTINLDYLSANTEFKIDNNSCNLSKITFNDLKKEFFDLENLVNEQIYSLNEEEHAAADLAKSQLNIIKIKFENLINYINSLNIQNIEPILTVSERLYLSNQTKRKQIAASILIIFSQLADLSLFLKIKRSSKMVNLIIVAGYKHCENLKSLLTQSNCNLIYSTGDTKQTLDTREIEKVFRNLKSDFFIV